jgi:hypothetical protein
MDNAKLESDDGKSGRSEAAAIVAEAKDAPRDDEPELTSKGAPADEPEEPLSPTNDAKAEPLDEPKTPQNSVASAKEVAPADSPTTRDGADANGADGTSPNKSITRGKAESKSMELGELHTNNATSSKQSLGAFHHLAPMKRPSQLEGKLGELRSKMASEMSGGGDAPWDPFGKPVIGAKGGGGALGGSSLGGGALGGGGSLGAIKRPGALGGLEAKKDF